MKIVIENVKSFDGLRKIPIKPITLITGENSSGKSAFLQAFSATYRTISRANGDELDPFFLPFDEIASFKGGRFGRSDQFTFGIEHNEGRKSPSCTIVCSSKNGLSDIAKVEYKYEGKKIGVDYHEGKISIESNGKVTEIGIKDFTSIKDINNSFKLNIMRIMNVASPKSQGIDWLELERSIRRARFTLASNQLMEFAPIRAKPQKYYDGIEVEEDFTGTRSPYLLKRAFENSKKTDFHTSIKKFKEFGKKSGLFGEIMPRKLGRNSTDPFQIQIGMNGPSTSLTNVGYGVNQALPIIAHMFFESDSNDIIVIQQPEVHLHPRAQAELGSLFALFAKEKAQTYIIETHSDYVVDRIRLAVSQGVISKNDVVILHFSKKQGSTHIDEIHLDELGQITNPPQSYRDFFLREQYTMLGIDL